MTANLDRRLTALEEVAERIRRREIGDLFRRLPEAASMTPAEFDAAIDGYILDEQRVEAWRREGLSERTILQHLADDVGVTIEELEHEARETIAILEH